MSGRGGKEKGWMSCIMLGNYGMGPIGMGQNSNQWGADVYGKDEVKVITHQEQKGCIDIATGLGIEAYHG